MMIEDTPPLNKQSFNELVDQVKEINIGQKLMNHMIDCVQCRERAQELNKIALLHIAEIERLQ